MQEKSIKKNAVLNVIKTVCAIIFPLITFPYASRVLLPEGIGKVQFANAIIGYLSIIASLGIATYAIRGAAKVRDDSAQLSQFVREVLVINLSSTALAYLGLGVVLLLPSLRAYRTLLIICSATLFLTTIGIDWLYAALEDFQYITIRSLVFQAISMLLLFTFIKTKDDYVKYAAIAVFSSTGSNLLNFFHARRYIRLFERSRLELKKHIRPILILFVTSVAINIFTLLDVSMLGFLTTDTEVGYYSAAAKIVRMIRDLFPAVFTVLFARLSYYVAHNNKDELIALSTKTLHFIFFFAPPMAAGLIILIPTIVSILCGDNFLPAIAAARVMAPLLLLSSYSGFLGGQILVSLQKEKTYMYCTIFAATADIILNFIFIPRFGALGAAIATLLAEVITFIMYSIILRQFLSHIHLKKYIVQYACTTILMGVILYAIEPLLPSAGIKLVAIPVAGICIYLSVLAVMKNPFATAIITRIVKLVRR